MSKFRVGPTGCVTVLVLKKLIEEQEGVRPQAITVLFRQRTLEDQRALSWYGLKDQDTLHIVIKWGLC